MPGQLIQRGERTWLVRVYLGRDGETHKRKYHNKTVHGTKKDAQGYLTRILRDRDTGTYVEPSRQALGAYLDQWLEAAARPRVGGHTFEDYRKLLRLYVRPALGAKQLSQVSPIDVQALYNGMSGRGLSAKTVRYTHTTLRSALEQAVKWRLLAQNPARYVELPRLERKEMQALSPAEAGRFLAAASADRWHPLFLLALTTGMRPGECLALQWKDVNFGNGVISVCRALVWHGGRWHFAEPKTARSRRTVKMLPTLAATLRAHKTKQAEERLAAGPAYQAQDLVFADAVGKPLHYRNLVRRHFKPILKAAGLPATIRLYDLRHTSATLLLAAGENPKVVSERLGHASVTLTLDTYSHVLPDMQQRAADRLEALLFAGEEAGGGTQEAHSGKNCKVSGEE